MAGGGLQRAGTFAQLASVALRIVDAFLPGVGATLSAAFAAIGVQFQQGIATLGFTELVSGNC